MRTPGKGGLARRAGTLDELRAAGPLIAIELGGTLSGAPATVRSGGRLAAELLANAHYDAVVLASADLVLPELDALLGMDLPWIGANVYQGGTRRVAPYVVKGDVAIVGLCDVPGKGVLPAGLEVRDPAQELAAVLATLRTTAVKRVIVATSMPAIAARGLGGDFVLGRADGAVTGAAQVFGGRLLAVSPAGPEIVAADISEAITFRAVPVNQPLGDPARVILERYGVLPGAATATPEPGVESPDGGSGVMRAHSRAVALEVHGFKLQPDFAKIVAPAGGTLVLVDSQWRNVLPLSLVYGQLKSTAYRVPNLRDHAYLVADGCRLLRIAEDAQGSPGHLPVRDFQLPDLGSRQRGWLAFVADFVPQHSLELRVYDFAHGHLFIDLMGPAPEPAQPLAPPDSNEVLEAGVFGLRALDTWHGATAPAGKSFFAIDLRARSHFTEMVDAQAFDPHAKPGAKMQLGTVSDWTDAHRYAQLVVDGIYATPPLADSPLGDAPRFLPDRLTGDELVFLAPADARSLALRCDFPNAKLPGAAAPIRPHGLDFQLRGEPMSPPAGDALAAVDDDVFRFELIACDARTAGDGRVVSCTVRVTIRGEKGEVFQTHDQLQLAYPDGSLHAQDADASAALPWAPAPMLFVPPQSVRSFAVAFKAPMTGKLRLGYRGLTLQRLFDLPLAAATPPPDRPTEPKGEPIATTPTVEPKPVEKPVEKPVAPVEPKPSEKPAQPVEPKPVEHQPVQEPVANQEPAPIPRGIAGVGLTAAQVNAAIDRGADGLWAFVQKADIREPSHPYGYEREHLLTSLALLHADLHRRNPAFDTAVQGQLQRLEPLRLGNYELGLACMVIERYGDPAFLPKLHLAARLLFEGQGPQGSWNYNVDVAPERLVDPEEEQALKVYGGVPLDSDLPPWERVPGKSTDGDNSVTQYALLGLRSAANAGVPLPAEVWERALQNQRGRQCHDGSWAYTTGYEGYGSMTAAGIAALAICKHQLGQTDTLDDPQVKAGLAWMSKYFTVTGHPKQSGWEFYYLYALERVGRLLDIEFIGRNEWYPLGARSLVDRQKPSGLWDGIDGNEKSDTRLPSSFAILFLTRATEALSPLKRRGGTGTLRASVALPPSLRLYLVLDASGSMLERMGDKSRFDSAKDAVYTLIDALPDTAQVALRVYGHRKRAIEPGAEEDTELLVNWQKLDRAALHARIAALRARGRTPLSLSLQQAARELGRLDPNDPLTFVLLTDGGDDTKQRGDFVDAAKAITARGGVRFNVVGFTIDRPDWTDQLKKAATAAGGSYVPATDVQSLGASLRAVVFGIPDGFVVRGPDGAEHVGKFGDELTLPEGKYEVSVAFGDQKLTRTAWVNTGGHTGIVFDARRLTK